MKGRYTGSLLARLTNNEPSYDDGQFNQTLIKQPIALYSIAKALLLVNFYLNLV
jgi:hypothetical protein